MTVRSEKLLSACSTIALLALVPLLIGDARAQTAATTAATTSTNPALAVNATTGVPADAASTDAGTPAAGVSDPGVRSGASAGGPLPGLNKDELNFFFNARDRFQEVDSVNGTIADVDKGLPSPETGAGLGPSFNGNACAQCHIFPKVGGGSPPTTNPQVTLATLDGATNTVPPFVANGGPIREARFIDTSGGGADGGVHDLFVITGRTDATNQPNANTGTNTTCTVPQTNFPAQIASNNIIFRIPISVFGDGLVENIGELTLKSTPSSGSASASASSLGITVGKFNHSPNDGTITRFGWKAQNKSLLLFAGEAYNVEQGVTNELFANERAEQFQDGFESESAEAIKDCFFNATPEDATAFENTRNSNSPASDFSSDIVNFAGFMRLLNQPTPAASTTATEEGETAFLNIGCGICHTPTFTTDASIFTAQSEVAVSPFSDFALHAMGTVLQDQVKQGQANGEEFRSAPLFGVGQRAFLLHDGRTQNLVTAIEDHASSGSEASQVITNFNNLTATEQQNIVTFLRSL
jgi:CxxC motif-containing protein (DUF1111 family)